MEQLSLQPGITASQESKASITFFGLVLYTNLEHFINFGWQHCLKKNNYCGTVHISLL